MPSDSSQPPQCIAFVGNRRLASGSHGEVALKLKATQARALRGAVLVFDVVSSEAVELDLRGSAQSIAKRHATPPPVATEAAAPVRQGPGRPKLGVVAREVTLLPRHWQWLAEQPGGASVSLRRLVDEARRANAGKDARRRAQESAYRFMVAMAGNQPGFEESARALFRGDRAQFERMSAPWPRDVRAHACRLAALAFDPAMADRATINR